MEIYIKDVFNNKVKPVTESLTQRITVKQLLTVFSVKIKWGAIWFSIKRANMKSNVYFTRYLGEIEILKNKFVMKDFGVLFYKDGKIFTGDI